MLMQSNTNAVTAKKASFGGEGGGEGGGGGGDQFWLPGLRRRKLPAAKNYLHRNENFLKIQQYPWEDNQQSN